MSKKYREFEAINYSTLSAISSNPWLYKNNLNRDDTESHSMQIGSAIDTMLTNNSQFWEYYIVENVAKQTGLMGLFIDEYLALIKKHNMSPTVIDYELIQIAYDKAGFKRDSIDKVKAALESEPIREYMLHVELSSTKTILTVEDFTTILNAVNNIKSSVFNKYFKESTTDYTNKYQVEIYWDDNSKKSLLDIIHIDNVEKTVELIDLKTTSRKDSFHKSIDKYRYDIQAAFYTDAFLTLDEYKDYTFIGFKFLVVNLDSNSPPTMYKLSDDLSNRGKYGITDVFGRKFKGYLELIDDLKWHQETNNWQYKKEFYDNNMCYIIN